MRHKETKHAHGVLRYINKEKGSIHEMTKNYGANHGFRRSIFPSHVEVALHKDDKRVAIVRFDMNGKELET